MRILTRAEVAAGGVLASVVSGPPLTLRQTFAESGVCELTLVGSAAGPLAGDELALELAVADGARARLRATGASIAQGPGERSVRIDVRVGDGAALDADPGPLIVCSGADVDVAVSIELAATASLRWRELLVLGRTSEPAGTAVLTWNVHRAGVPVLIQRVDLREPALTSWRGHADSARVLATELSCGPPASTHVLAPTAVRVALDERTSLTTVLAGRTDEAFAQLELLAGGSTRASEDCGVVF